MFPLMSFTKIGIIIATAILASSFAISSALTCYSCSYTADYDASYDDIGLPVFTQKCVDPKKDEAPTVVCTAPDVTACYKTFTTVNITYDNGTSSFFKVVIRDCDDEKLEDDVDRKCEPTELTFARSDGVKKKEKFLKMAKQPFKRILDLENATVESDGVTCWCKEDNCNSQPGIADNNKDYDKKTTTPKPNGSQANNIQNSLLASLLAFWLYAPTSHLNILTF